MAIANPPKPPVIKQIPIPPQPKPLPSEDDLAFDDELTDEEDNLNQTIAPTDPAADEEDDQNDDNVDADFLNDEEDDQVDDDQAEVNNRQQRDRSQKDEPEEPEEPGQQRSEDPTLEANRNPDQEPKSAPSAKAKDPTKPEVGEGVAKGARAAEGEVSGAGKLAAEGIKDTAKVAETATKAAAETAVKAAPAVIEAAAASAPVWGPIVIIIVVVLLVGILLYSLFSGSWKRIGHGGDLNGSGATTPADLSDPTLREQVAELAVAAGDGTMRQTITKEKLADVFTRINRAATAAANHPSRDLLVTHLTAAQAASSILVEATATTGDPYTRQLNLFQYHLFAVAAALMGIGTDTPDSLVTRATDSFNSSFSWISTANDRDSTAPLRDGSNIIPPTGSDGTRGCDPAGYITYILRNPSLTATDAISPNVVDLPTVYAPALQKIDTSGGFTLELLQAGDIILTKYSTTVNNATQTDYGAFIYLGGDDQQLAYCGENGPTQLPSSILTAPGRTVTDLLRLRTAP